MTAPPESTAARGAVLAPPPATTPAPEPGQAAPGPAGLAASSAAGTTRAPLPEFEAEHTGSFERFLVGTFVAVPLLAVFAAIPLLWGWGLGWHDAVIALAMYWISGLGVTVGFHRYFTHKSFKAKRPLRIALAICGNLAIEGPVLVWVADHRRHHKYSDKEGDPHSPWRFGDDWKALTKGLVFAHVGWLFDPNKTSLEKFCPDLLADSDIRKVSKSFPAAVAASPHLRQGGVRVAGQVEERGLAGDRILRRVLAQSASCRPHLRASWRAEGPARLERPGHLGIREAGLGL